ncbi:hypothetical protein D1164_17805 [Mariniphaga sediminis]|uniref:Uncharacterized protein n=1 Tax=Mariniphaga sediminis TaxID=1628158 RepID=A0A399D0B1_9BACT|nr:hypothetical protein [Mariniphaga sediminis]RIH63790.1 hypothetical protein D1164_17805 [Mariniphaga sediminis]
MKRIKLIHREPHSECMETLKETIVKDSDLKIYLIDKDTLIQNLPEKIVNNFLDFLSGYNRKDREILLKMIKEGSLILDCSEY